MSNSTLGVGVSETGINSSVLLDLHIRDLYFRVHAASGGRPNKIGSSV